MKLLCQYKFTNNKAIKVEFINNKEIKKLGLNKSDNFVLVFQTGKKRNEMGLRIDEMVSIITLLSYAVWKSTRAYKIGLLKGYNGFKF